MKHTLFIFLLLGSLIGVAQKKIIVDLNGHGDFKSIQEAINSLSDTSIVNRVVFIKNGVYNEKIFIEKHNILLVGEDREKVIVTQSIARDEFRCSHNDDWGVATINVNGNNISLQNLTIRNSYGFETTNDKTIDCLNDTISHKKIVRKNGHQMALRTMKATRFKAVNCTFSSFGGDTVSPWNVDNGMFYFKDCSIEGGVDFYCPRGWAWAENCDFKSLNGTASIWHDGSKNKDSKSVLINCRFKGFDNFYLGRYHRDAQMYLVNCLFADNMRDSAIYHVSNISTISFGHRMYFSDCHRKAGDYSWFADNLPQQLKEKEITVNWLFNGAWSPDKK